jgi:uncharacterized protein YecE (DUF72 family)
MKTSIGLFLGQGLTALKDKLGPINWQFPPTRKFEREYFDTFLSLLPKEKDGVRFRHVLEVRHPSCDDPALLDLLTKHGASVVYAEDDDFPKIRHEGAAFAVARLMQTKSGEPTGYPRAALDRLARTFEGWANSQDVYVFFISGAKERNPAAAMALQSRLGLTPRTSGDADALAAGKAKAAGKKTPVRATSKPGRQQAPAKSPAKEAARAAKKSPPKKTASPKATAAPRRKN